MRTILVILLVANIFIAGCKAQEKNATQKDDEMTSQINKTADELNKQIDALSGNIKGISAALRKKMPEIFNKIQDLVTRLQQMFQEFLGSINSKEPSDNNTQTQIDI